MANKKSILNKENKNSKNNLKQSDDGKTGLMGAPTKDDLIARKNGIPPVEIPENAILTETSEYLITQSGEYLVWNWIYNSLN